MHSNRPQNCPNKQLSSIQGSDKNKTKCRNSIVGFVGGLPVQTTLQELEAYVRSFGPIYYLSLPVDSVTGRRHKGFAKVFYKKQESLDAAISCPKHSLHGVEFGFSAWVPKKKFSSKKEKPAANKLFFKMSALIEESILLRFFSEFGPVLNLEVKQDYEIGKPRNFGFVVFQYDEDALSVINSGSLFHLNKKKLMVQPSKTTKQVVKASKQARDKDQNVRENFLHQHQNAQFVTASQTQNHRCRETYRVGMKYPLKNEQTQNSEDRASFHLCRDAANAQSCMYHSHKNDFPDENRYKITPISREHSQQVDLNHDLSNLRLRRTIKTSPQNMYLSFNFF